MSWLVRLVTPPGGTILDPFAGSGSTMIAAVAEGFDAVGIEQDERSVGIARARVAFWAAGGRPEVERAVVEARRRSADAGQLNLLG